MNNGNVVLKRLDEIAGKTDNFTRNAFKSWGYDQIFNLLMTEGTNQLILDTTSNFFRYMVYSSIASSLGSGWF